MSKCKYVYDEKLSLFSQVENILKESNCFHTLNKLKNIVNQLVYTVDNDIQRFYINQALRTIIGMYPENTIETRTYLIDDGINSDWMRLFELGVLPCVIRNNIQSNT